MAFLHRAWLFEPEVAHRAIADAVVEGDRISVARLSQLARATVEAGHAEFLRTIAFDVEALDDEPDPAHFYVVALGRYLRTAGSIRHPGILLGVLQELGWTRSSAWLLIRGHPLRAILPGVRDPLMDLVRDSLGQFGGWMSNDHCRTLLARVQLLEERFLDVDEALLHWMAARIHQTGQPARTMLREMYESVAAFLEQGARLSAESAVLSIAP